MDENKATEIADHVSQKFGINGLQIVLLVALQAVQSTIKNPHSLAAEMSILVPLRDDLTLIINANNPAMENEIHASRDKVIADLKQQLSEKQVQMESCQAKVQELKEELKSRPA